MNRIPNNLSLDHRKRAHGVQEKNSHIFGVLDQDDKKGPSYRPNGRNSFMLRTLLVIVIFYGLIRLLSNVKTTGNQLRTLNITENYVNPLHHPSQDDTVSASSVHHENNTQSPPRDEIDEIVRYCRRIVMNIHKSNSTFEKLKLDMNYNEAMKVVDQALESHPNAARLHSAKGSLFFVKGAWSKAEEMYRKALKIEPNNPKHASNIARCLVRTKNPEKMFLSIEFWQKASELEPNNLVHTVGLTNAMWTMNIWDKYEEWVSKLIDGTIKEIKNNSMISVNPYIALHLPLTLEHLLKISASYSQRAKDHAKEIAPNCCKGLPKKNNVPNTKSDRIKIGYISQDLYNHAIGLAVQSVFGFHDRTKFEVSPDVLRDPLTRVVQVFVYNLNDVTQPNWSEDRIYAKIYDSAEHFVQLGHLSLQNAVEKIIEDQIYIMIDLGLFTGRMELMSLRPAPIQIAYMGLAVTTGSDYHDYIVVDKFVVPQESTKYFSEKLIWMPHAYHVWDHKQMYRTKPNQENIPPFFTQQLPEGYFRFCNYANSLRIEPTAWKHWMNILNRVPNSVLILKMHSSTSAANLANEARKMGVNVVVPATDDEDAEEDDPNKSRIVFQRGIPGRMHIAVKSLCDLYLDLHWYNGHSTAADMLWAGVPMLTYPGESIASRAAASLALATKAQTMIASSWQEYEDMAVRIANDKSLHTSMKRQLDYARDHSPLFDTKSWVKSFERALVIAYERLQNGTSPENIEVQDANTD